MSNSSHLHGHPQSRAPRPLAVLVLLFAVGLPAGCVSVAWRAAEPAPVPLGAARRLTFEGARAGEGYFIRDGSALVFQS